MRTEFTNADLDFIVGKLKLSKDIGHLNRDAARVELRTLISVGIAILTRPPDIAPGLQNRALDKIGTACFALREALEQGHDALLHRAGYAAGAVHEANSPASVAFDVLQRVGPMLDALGRLAAVPALPAGRGKPVDDRRMIFLQECARYFQRWTGKKLAGSRGSRFSNFAQALFSTMEIASADDLSWQIKRALEKKGS
jgi:hypothetical protein